jgi:hypothetical protein
MRFLLLSTAFLAFVSSAHAEPVFRPIVEEQPAEAVAATAQPRISHHGEIIDSVGGDAIPALPIEAVQENGITYLSGGIGDEEVAQLKQEESKYNLRLQITGKGGEYLSEVQLTLKDKKDSALVSIMDAGPYVYFQLPAGEYVVEALPAVGDGKKVPIKVPVNAVAVKAQIRL